MSPISQNIEKLRLRRKLTQAETADRLEVTEETVASWESGETQPNIDTLDKITDMFTSDIATVIYGDPARKRHIRQFAIACGILLILSLALYFLSIASRTSQDYLQTLLMVSQLIYIKPAFWLVFGWTAMQGLGLLGVAKPARSKASKPLHITVLVLVLLYVALNLLQFIELTNTAIIVHQFYQNHSLNEALSPEIFQSVFNMPRLISNISVVVNTLIRQPGVFVIPGILYWLSKSIKIKPKQ